jgi:glycosyltransferase involved in cell wall biosynthesis
LNPVLRFLARCAYGRAAAGIEIAKSGIDSGEAFSSRRKFRVSNGIDVPDMLPRVESCNTDKPPRILYMAGLRETKGVMDIVHTASELKARNINVIFDIVGPWQEEDTRRSFEDAVVEADVTDYIVMHGRVTGTEKWVLYRDAALFFFPSYYESENFPLVLIEAMAFGLPVVATRWRGIPEMVVEGKTGALCDIRSPAQFADALDAIISDPDGYEVMSAAAYARYASKYTQQVFLGGMRKVFEAVIGEEGGKQ